ncbi:MAG: hypothetical protein NVS3B21_15450 [Acidimicrobiales bacterium]
MTPLEEVDAHLADWTSKMTRIDENLVDLDADPVYSLLEKAGPDGLVGASKTRVGPAIAEMQELFGHRGLLDDVLRQAREIRATVTKFRHGKRLLEVDALLHGPSIQLPPLTVPVTGRGLLGVEETPRAVTPAQLLASMTAAFDRVRGVVSDVTVVWDGLGPRLDAAERLIGELEAGALKDQVSQALDEARRALRTDPLGEPETQILALERRLARTGTPPPGTAPTS